MDRQRRIEKFILEAHRLVVERLRSDPMKLQVLRDTLLRWRSQPGQTRSDPYFDEWQRLLAQGVDAIKQRPATTTMAMPFCAASLQSRR